MVKTDYAINKRNIAEPFFLPSGYIAGNGHLHAKHT